MRYPNFDDARPLIEEEIERLIGVLDLLEADPDLEENGDLEGEPDDEPELGWTAAQARTGSYAWNDVFGLEPSLGSTNDVNQAHWSRGRLDDSEQQHDGQEPDCAAQDAGCNFTSVDASETLQASKSED